LSTHIAVRVSYPERGDYNWYEALATYAEVGCVEVAFYRPELFLQRVTTKKVLAPFSTLPLTATSVHMAQVKIADFGTFLAVLRKTISIAQGLDCSLIVVHPTNARLEEVEGKIAAAVDPLLAQAGVTLCWETFAGRRRFLSGIEGIAAFCRGGALSLVLSVAPLTVEGLPKGRQHHAVRPFDRVQGSRHAACYDTAHLHKPQGDVLADIVDYSDCIHCFHLSNRGAEGRQQHLPLRHPVGVLDFEEIVAAIVESGLDGPLTLEYLPQYHNCLLEDALWAGQMLRR